MNGPRVPSVSLAAVQMADTHSTGSRVCAPCSGGQYRLMAQAITMSAAVLMPMLASPYIICWVVVSLSDAESVNFHVPDHGFSAAPADCENGSSDTLLQFNSLNLVRFFGHGVLRERAHAQGNQTAGFAFHYPAAGHDEPGPGEADLRRAPEFIAEPCR